jgi:hypothetical protein
MELTNETKIRVCRSVKIGNDYGKPEWYLTTNFKNLQTVLGFKHRDGVERAKRELAEGGVLSLLYHNGVCYGIGLEEGRIQVPTA